jgi:hypothetical protein
VGGPHAPKPLPLGGPINFGGGHPAAWLDFCHVQAREALLLQILRGSSDANIPFDGLRSLLRALGFEEHIRGSHHIFTREGIEEILNLQPKGAQARAYQVKQVRQTILKYRLGGESHEA